MFNKRTIYDAKIKNQVILVRTDYNVPLDSDGNITNDLRIRASLETLNFLVENGAKKIIIISHLGRPEGVKNKALSLRPVAARLSELMPDVNVSFVDDVSGPEVESATRSLKKGDILVLENLRFFAGEEKNSDDFIREIIDCTGATLAVQDGFAVVHRAHASTSAIANEIPVVAGALLEKEISTLSEVIERPRKPLTVIIGGSKVEDKQPMIDNFLPIADHIVVGGKIAADGYASDNTKIYVAEDFDEDSEGNKLDIGPLSSVKIADFVNNSETVIWNGVLGKVEDPAFATSSTILAKLLGEKLGITSVICGGDTTGFVENLTQENPDLRYTLISTGGGAALEFLSGKPLPGVDVLEDKS